MKTFFFLIILLNLSLNSFSNEFYLSLKNNEVIDNDDEKFFYNKHYKRISSTKQIHYRERIYYGPQADILREFAHPFSTSEIDSKTLTKFPMASFFSPTAIRIPFEKHGKADSLYETLVDHIFSGEHIPSTTHVTILVLGYTDFSAIDEDSTLYKELLAETQKEFLTMEEYYQYTSYFRAKEVGNIISKLIHQRKEDFTTYDKLIIDIIQEGRGTEYPDTKRNYEMIDDKRRLTKVYWDVR